MKKWICMFAGLCLAGLAGASARADIAVTVKAVPLQAAAQSDAATLATLEQDTRVEVLVRKGAWNQVKTQPGQTGWVRMMSLKYESAPGAAGGANAASANPLGALNNLFGGGRTASNATVTTGVRGLSAEDLENAQANSQELEKMKTFGIDKKAAQSFAKRSKVAPEKVDYLPEPAPAPAPAFNNDQMGG